jgi:hypothetical protein
MLYSFKNYLDIREMAVQTHFKFGGSEIPSGGKDTAGFNLMSRPGFRTSDRMLLIRDSQQAEQWLNESTEKDGIHWIVGYIEPPKTTKELDPEDWEKYHQASTTFGKAAMEQFPKTVLPPPSPNNTVVYVKPTSRLHPMTAWQQVHNIAHAVWNFNPKERQEAHKVIQGAVKELQQRIHAIDPNDLPPSEEEITVILARLLDNLMLQRALVLEPGELDDPKKVAHTGFNAYDEVMYDLVASYFRNKGHIPLRPRGVGKIAKFDRTERIDPNPEIVQKKGVRPWVWERLAADHAAWDDVAKKLDALVLEAIRGCVWAKIGGPVYPYKKLTTLP